MVAVASSILTVTCNNVVNDTTTLLHSKKFSLPARVQFIAKLSARDALRSIYLDVLGSDGSLATWLFDGAVNTTTKTFTGNAGSNNSATNNTSWPDLSLGYYVFETCIDFDQVTLSMFAANSGSSKSYNNLWMQNIPDPNVTYQIRIRVVNGATAPSSVTTLSIDSVLVVEQSVLPVDITGSRSHNTPERATPVNVLGLPTLSLQPASYQGGFTSAGYFISTTGTNANLLRAGAANLGYLHVTNLSAATKYLKLYNKATVPVIGTDNPVFIYPIPAGFCGVLVMSAAGIRAFPLGLGFGITANYAVTDTTAVAAGDVALNYAFI